MSDDRAAERARIQWLARKLGVRPEKSMGQNFLIDPSVIDKTIEVAGVNAGDQVLEIGPGLGVLTAELRDRARELVVIELDHELAEFLRREYRDSISVRIVEADGRHISLPEIGLGAETKVVANLPYSVGTVIVRRLLEAEPRPASLTVMLQREVAERMAAGPPDVSLLSLAVQMYAEPEIAFVVPPDAFWPEPKVASAVIHLAVRPEPLLSAPKRTALFRLAGAAFRAKRKTLANSLASELKMQKSDMSTILAASGVDPMARPQHVSLARWMALVARCEANGILDV